jgi:hypothetical protein
MQAGKKRGGIDEVWSSEVRWEERIEGAEMSGGEDRHGRGGQRVRAMMADEVFPFLFFFVFPFLFLLLNLFCMQRKQRWENM